MTDGEVVDVTGAFVDGDGMTYTDNTTKYPDVHVRLTGQDGGGMFIVGTVAKAIRAKHGAEASRRFSQEAFAADSYDDMLQIVLRTVNVS